MDVGTAKTSCGRGGDILKLCREIVEENGDLGEAGAIDYPTRFIVEYLLLSVSSHSISIFYENILTTSWHSKSTFYSNILRTLRYSMSIFWCCGIKILLLSFQGGTAFSSSLFLRFAWGCSIVLMVEYVTKPLPLVFGHNLL